VIDRGGSSTVRVRDAQGIESEIDADVVVGCDGARSTVAAALTEARTTEVVLPVRWLAVIGAAAPIEMHTIYGAHPRGFAGHMRRGPTQTRYYLEVPRRDAIAAWPEHRVRDELSERLGVHGRLDDIGFGEMTLVDLRVRVTEPMQQGAVFLAGDAAHLITPAGGKGMNLAIHDAVELAHGLIERFGPASDATRLEAYSRNRLREVWRTQAFSYWFLNLLLANGEATPPTMTAGLPAFTAGMRDGWIGSLLSDPLLATWFAHAYAGVDPT
jgi:p-hydroxybenzoate 3-monooxygenase